MVLPSTPWRRRHRRRRTQIRPLPDGDGLVDGDVGAEHSDKSVTESPPAGTARIEGIVDFDMSEDILDAMLNEGTHIDPLQFQVEPDGTDGFRLPQHNRVVRNPTHLFSTSPLPPMQPGAHPKPPSESIRSRKQDQTRGDKAFKDLVAKRIGARCARHVLSAAIRKFCCGRQCLRKMVANG